VYERPRLAGSVRPFVLRDELVTVAGRFCAIFLWPEIPFPGNGDRKRQETRFECRLRRRKSEHLVLPRPRGGQSARRATPHATGSRPRWPPFTRSGARKASEIVHVDLPNAAPLALWRCFPHFAFASARSSSSNGGLAQSMRPERADSERIGRACCGGSPAGRRISRRRVDDVLRHRTSGMLSRIALDGRASLLGQGG